MRQRGQSGDACVEASILCRYDRRNNNPSLNNTLMQRVNYTKFLGVIIDDGLKWTNHIAYVKNKIAKGFGIILRANFSIVKHSLIRTILSYFLT